MGWIALQVPSTGYTSLSSCPISLSVGINGGQSVDSPLFQLQGKPTVCPARWEVENCQCSTVHLVLLFRKLARNIDDTLHPIPQANSKVPCPFCPYVWWNGDDCQWDSQKVKSHCEYLFGWVWWKNVMSIILYWLCGMCHNGSNAECLELKRCA